MILKITNNLHGTMLYVKWKEFYIYCTRTLENCRWFPKYSSVKAYICSGHQIYFIFSICTKRKNT